MEKGLRFYCDEKYTFGHKCKTSVHVLIVPDSEDSMDEEGIREDATAILAINQEKVDIVVSTPQISFHVMSGVFFSSNFEVQGFYW